MSTLFSLTHQSPCTIIEEISLWGETSYRVWLQNEDRVVRVPAEDLIPISETQQPDREGHRLNYLAAAARIAQTIQPNPRESDESVLLAPLEADIIPLPHQLRALSRAVSGDQVRYLLADEVGLGKTIEAGLILRELKMRGLVKRVLVVVPKSLATQWAAEMQDHFQEDFQLVLPEDIRTLNRLQSGFADAAADDLLNNAWTLFDQVIVTMDSVKPMDRRRGWSDERLSVYNQRRFEDLVSAGWDLVIVDEAHKMGGSSESIARHQLGRGLSDCAPYLLLLSATPHQGKTEAFLRLLSLLDPQLFVEGSRVSKEKVRPFIIRTKKRDAVDVNGKPIFTPRTTTLQPIAWEARHAQQARLYELVTNYVREGYNQALQEKKHHIGFLMVLMQRLVVSSTRAIRTSLERRLAVLNEEITGHALPLECLEDTDEYFDLDGQDLLEAILEIRESADQDERDEVALLLQQARQCEQSEVDAKAEALLETLYRLQNQTSNPDLKVLIFTEFVSTQEMLADYLRGRGVVVATLNGGMSMAERRQAQVDFSQKAQILVSTDAGGEGLNLQFCHVVINYDIPWNPMRLEQRIGRVDRIGQEKPVQAFNFIFEESIEFRVREVLEEKLNVIYQEFGIDKTSDVLDSGQAGKLFEDAFIRSISTPETLEDNVEAAVQGFRAQVEDVTEHSVIRDLTDAPDIQSARAVKYHPLNHWVESMMIAHYRSEGAHAVNLGHYWEVVDPSKNLHQRISFMKTANLLGQVEDVTTLNVESEPVRACLENLSAFSPGAQVPVGRLPDLPESLSGNFALAEISISLNDGDSFAYLRMPHRKRGFLAVFLSDQGQVFLPTAQKIWQTLVSEPVVIQSFLPLEASRQVYEEMTAALQTQGQRVYEGLMREHTDWLAQEEERGRVYFQAKESGIEKIGLPEVREYRLRKLVEERKQWRAEMRRAEQPLPDLKPLVLLRIGDNHGG